MSFILIADRHFGAEHAEKVAQLAGEFTEIHGFDLASDEANFPPGLFQKAFTIAAETGKFLTCHAGEAAGAHSVAVAIDQLGVSRIGHGVRILENADVVQKARDQNITLEVCPISNVQTGTIEHMDHHPLRELMAQNLKVTLNTDDPGICNESFSSELLNAIEAFSLSLNELVTLGENAAESAFVSCDMRQCLRQQFQQQGALVVDRFF